MHRHASFVRSFDVPLKPFRHASDDRASDARVDRRVGGAGGTASFACAGGFAVAVFFAAAAGLFSPSPAVFPAGRGVFRSLPTTLSRPPRTARGRVAVEGFSAVA